MSCGRFILENASDWKKKTCLRSQNSQSLSARNWHYAQVFLRSNHFFASSVRCTERDPLPLHSWPQSAFLLSPPSHTPASPPFSPSLIHVSSPLHHYKEHKFNRMRAHFNQTICALTKLSLSLPLFSLLILLREIRYECFSRVSSWGQMSYLGGRK